MIFNTTNLPSSSFLSSSLLSLETEPATLSSGDDATTTNPSYTSTKIIEPSTLWFSSDEVGTPTTDITQTTDDMATEDTTSPLGFVTLTETLDTTYVEVTTIATTVYTEETYLAISQQEMSQVTQGESTTQRATHTSESLSLASSETYYVYTQNYEITASTTTFTTGLPTTLIIPTSASSTFSIPTSVITTDAAFYKNWLSGSLDSDKSYSSRNNKHTIIGATVGSVCGFLLCLLMLWLMFFRKRKNKIQADERGFSHEIGRRLDSPPEVPEAAEFSPSELTNPKNARSVDDEAFLKGKYKMLGKRLPPLPLWSKKNLNSDENFPVIPEKEEKDVNPFKDEFDFQQRLPPSPAPPAQPHLSHYNNRFSFMSSMSESTSSSGEYTEGDTSLIELWQQGPQSSAQDQNTRLPHTSQSLLREVI